MLKQVSADEKLKLALGIYQEKWLATFPADNKIEPYKFSSLFEKKMNRLIRAQRKPYYSMVNTIGKRVAVIIIAIFIILTSTVLNVKALCDPVINFFIEVYEEFSRINF